jgi:hypothetical protein
VRAATHGLAAGQHIFTSKDQPAKSAWVVELHFANCINGHLRPLRAGVGAFSAGAPHDDQYIGQTFS